jgi:hypothetical protein
MDDEDARRLHQEIDRLQAIVDSLEVANTRVAKRPDRSDPATNNTGYWVGFGLGLGFFFILALSSLAKGDVSFLILFGVTLLIVLLFGVMSRLVNGVNHRPNLKEKSTNWREIEE